MLNIIPVLTAAMSPQIANVVFVLSVRLPIKASISISGWYQCWLYRKNSRPK